MVTLQSLEVRASKLPIVSVHKFSKILGARVTTLDKFRTGDLRILSATIQNVIARELCTLDP
jgi:hypothetical protein